MDAANASKDNVAECFSVLLMASHIGIAKLQIEILVVWHWWLGFWHLLTQITAYTSLTALWKKNFRTRNHPLAYKMDSYLSICEEIGYGWKFWALWKLSSWSCFLSYNNWSSCCNCSQCQVRLFPSLAVGDWQHRGIRFRVRGSIPHFAQYSLHHQLGKRRVPHAEGREYADCWRLFFRGWVPYAGQCQRPLTWQAG